jgi:hypothetical protein
MNKYYSDEICPEIEKSYLVISDQAGKFIQEFLADHKFAKFIYKIIRRDLPAKYELYAQACKSWHECMPYIPSELNAIWQYKLNKIEYAARISMKMSMVEVCEKKMIGVFFFDFGRTFPELHLVNMFLSVRDSL